VTDRSLAEILLDLHEADRENQEIAAKFEKASDQREEEELGDKGAAVDARIDRLRDEFKQTFRRVTGVSWSNVETALTLAIL
jgi:hypothetical protein